MIQSNTEPPEHTPNPHERIILTRTSYFQRRVLGAPLTLWLILLAVLVAAGAGALYLRGSQSNSPMAAKRPMVDRVAPPRSEASEVQLTNESIVRANVSVQEVIARDFLTDLTALGIIEIAEPAERTITARARGRIVRIYNGTTGTYVKKGEPLYDFYSPDILNAEQEFLVALQGVHDHASNAGVHVHMNAGLIIAGRSRLTLLGLSESQIAALETTKHITDKVTVVAPESGMIVQRLTEEGAYVDEGTAILRLADLSTVWGEIDVPESDIRYMHIGQQVSIANDAYPAKHFTGHVITISPIADQSSRSIRVRVALSNPNYELRPQMTFDATFELHNGNALAVPVSAVVRTGKADYVWVETAPNSFSSRTVVLGAPSPDGYYAVDSGLLAGDRVAVTGAFFLDAERQLTANNPMGTMNMSAGDQGSKNSGSGKGVIRSIDAGKHMITLDHGNISGVMPAMTMAYKVSDPAMLTAAQPNQEVRFTLTKADNGEYLITAISK